MHRQIDDGVQRLEATSVLVKDGSREQGQLANSTTDLTLQTIPPNTYRFHLNQVPKWQPVEYEQQTVIHEKVVDVHRFGLMFALDGKLR